MQRERLGSSIAEGYRLDDDDLSGTSVEGKINASSKLPDWAIQDIDEHARSIASLRIVELFDKLASHTKTTSQKVEVIKQGCWSEDVKLRQNAIREITSLATALQATADQKRIIAPLPHLLQSPDSTECRDLGAVSSSQIWQAITAANEMPGLQPVVAEWLTCHSAQLLKQSPACFADALACLKRVKCEQTQYSVFSILLRCAREDIAMKIAILECVVSKAPSAEGLCDDCPTELGYLEFFLHAVVRLLKHPGVSSSPVLKYLTTVAAPALLSKRLTAHTPLRLLLILSVEACISQPSSPEIPIYLQKLKHLVLMFSDCVDWALTEPLVLAFYIALRKAPSYFPISTDASRQLTPALRRIWYQAQCGVSKLAGGGEDESGRRQCGNVVLVTREMLKPVRLRRVRPPFVRFSWRGEGGDADKSALLQRRWRRKSRVN